MIQGQQNPQTPNSYESYLRNYIHRPDVEKTFIDKVLGRQDAERLKELMAKSELTRNDLTELLYLLTSVNLKLVNFNEWDRYLLGKFYAWIRDFVTLCEDIIDYEDDINDPTKGLISNTTDTQLKNIIERVRKHDIHNCKFLIDVFLYLSNSTLSIGGSGFDTLTTSKFEYDYGPYYTNPPQQKQSGFNFFMKGR